MKNKVKQLSSVLLVLTLVISVFTGCGETQSSDLDNKSNDDVWVLTKETVEYTDGSPSREKTYTYDSSGKVIGLYQSGDSWYYEYKNITHDNNGNIISYTEECVYPVYDSVYSYAYSFTYDNSGNCVSTVVQGDSYSYNLATDFDDAGNILKETYSYPDATETYNHSLKYENGICVEDEIEAITSDGKRYNLDSHFYDDNNNLEHTRHYVSVDSSNGNSDTILANGKNYKLVYNKYYTWEKLSDVAIQVSYTSTQASTTADKYNGFPAPIELNLAYSNGKTSLANSTEYKLDIDGLYLIKDTDGYDYLALKYTISTLSDYKIKLRYFTNIELPTLIQNDNSLERYYNLSDECKAAYSDIISTDYIPTELRPGETVTSTAIFEVYDTTSDIYVEIMPSYADSTDSGIIRFYSFN